MRRDAGTRTAAAQWLAKPTEDLGAARVLAAGYPGPACFHCQQAVEKALKALLALHDQPIRKTHDLRELGQAVGDHYPELLPAVGRAAPLTVFASRALSAARSAATRGSDCERGNRGSSRRPGLDAGLDASGPQHGPDVVAPAPPPQANRRVLANASRPSPSPK